MARVCIEIKKKLSGRTDRFACLLLYWDTDFGILRYVIEQTYNVQGILLKPGDITYGMYWLGRPYTLYVWPRPQGRSIYYFNIADSIVLTPSEFTWRDLTVDVLVDADSRVHVLDEHELPPTLPEPLRRFIDVAKNEILRDYAAIIDEAENTLASLW